MEGIDYSDKTLNEMFNGFVFCSSGFLPHEKQLIEQMVVAAGGTYIEHLSISSVIYLIAKNSYSSKISTCQQYGIPILRLQWLFDCISERKVLSINDYILPREPIAFFPLR